ncbi:hypothetical protein RQN30_06335 [Arcanobacterium hippocoleae]
MGIHGDQNLLNKRVYPLLKEEANFYINYMLHKGRQPAADGKPRLTTGVAYSPEHGPQGTDGNTYESALVWQLLNDSIESATTLGVDQNLVHGTGDCSADNWKKNDAGAWINADANRSWTCALTLLKPIEVGASGQIKEWFFEGAIGKMSDGSPIRDYQADHHHRHLSHLLGLFPGDLITIDNADYMDAAKVSLTTRGDDATGWGVGQRINAWARTGDGNHAYTLIEKQIKSAMYPNLFDAHPPFQIDGNFGNTSGVNEMLMQSNSTYMKDGTAYRNYINLLPALPDAWAAHGSAHGLVARGNFDVDMTWKQGTIANLKVTSHKGNQAVLAFPGAGTMVVKDTAGTIINPTILDDTHILFPTTAGTAYMLSAAPANQKVTPQEPTWDDTARTYTIPELTGVQYKVNGEPVTGTITVEGTGEVTVTVTAEALTGYVLGSPNNAQWEHTFPAAEIKMWNLNLTNATASVGDIAVSAAPAGDTVTVKAAAAPDGQVFAGWNVQGVTLTDEQQTSPRLTFTMPGNEVTLKAFYKNKPLVIPDRPGGNQPDGDQPADPTPEKPVQPGKEKPESADKKLDKMPHTGSASGWLMLSSLALLALGSIAVKRNHKA